MTAQEDIKFVATIKAGSVLRLQKSGLIIVAHPDDPPYIFSEREDGTFEKIEVTPDG